MYHLQSNQKGRASEAWGERCVGRMGRGGAPRGKQLPVAATDAVPVRHRVSISTSAEAACLRGMAQPQRDGDRVIDVVAGCGRGTISAPRIRRPDGQVWRDRLPALLRVQLSWRRPPRADLVYARVGADGGGVGAELQVCVGVLVVVLIVESPRHRRAQGDNNQTGNPHAGRRSEQGLLSFGRLAVLPVGYSKMGRYAWRAAVFSAKRPPPSYSRR